MKTLKLRKLFKICGIIYFLLLIRHNYCKLYRKFKKYPHGAIGIPLFGSLFEFAFNPMLFLLNIGDKYGKIATVSIGRRSNVFINDADLAQYVLKNGHTLNRSKQFAETRASTSTILPLLNGKEWAKRRKYAASKLLTITTSTFISSSVSFTMNKYVIPSINSCIECNTSWCSSLHTKYMTFNCIFAALFGCHIDLDTDDNNNFFTKWDKLIENLSNMKAKLNILDISGFTPPRWITNLFINGSNIELGIDGLITEWMQENGFNIDFERKTVVRNCNKHSFADEMIEQVNKKKAHYTLDAFIADLGSYLISGYHTTSNCADYGLLLLALNVDIQYDIYKELMRVKDQENGELNLNELHVFRAFIFEMIRLSTILPMGLTHFVDEDIAIDCGDCIIPKGSSILINHYYIHKSNGNYWQNTLSINKWLDNGVFKMNTNFVMFGYGKRDCVGKTLALKQLYSMFAVLIKQYRFTLSQDIDLEKCKIKQRWRALLEVYPKLPLKVEKRAS